MRYRYEDYPVDLLRQLLTYQELVKLFLQLVLQTGGDVEEALRWMQYLQERGMIDAGDRPRGVPQGAPEERDRRGPGRRARALGGRRAADPALRARGDLHVAVEVRPGIPRDPARRRGGELLPETRAYEFGDNPTAIDGIRTIGNAVRRDADDIALKPRTSRSTRKST